MNLKKVFSGVFSAALALTLCTTAVVNAESTVSENTVDGVSVTSANDSTVTSSGITDETQKSVAAKVTGTSVYLSDSGLSTLTNNVATKVGTGTTVTSIQVAHASAVTRVDLGANGNVTCLTVDITPTITYDGGTISDAGDVLVGVPVTVTITVGDIFGSATRVEVQHTHGTVTEWRRPEIVNGTISFVMDNGFSSFVIYPVAEKTTSSSSSTATVKSDWVPTHVVVFHDANGNVISTQYVSDGQAATKPAGYTYAEAALDWVYEDMSVYPVGTTKKTSSGYVAPNTADTSK